MRYHFLLQGTFPTQGPRPRLLCLLCWQADSLPLSHQGAHFHYWLKPFSRVATDLGLLEPAAKNQEVAPESQSILKHSHPDPCPLPFPPSLGAPSLILCRLHLLTHCSPLKCSQPPSHPPGPPFFFFFPLSFLSFFPLGGYHSVPWILTPTIGPMTLRLTFPLICSFDTSLFSAYCIPGSVLHA